MKKKSTGWYLLLFSAIVILFSVNFNNSFGFLIGENGEQITSTFLGDVVIDGNVNLKNINCFTEEVDVNAIRVIGGESTLINPTIDKSGNTEVEQAYVLGNNYAVWVRDDSILHIDGGNLNSSGDYAGGVCSYHGMVTLDNMKINTNGIGSSGVMSTNGGALIGNNLDVLTNMEGSPAISNIDGSIDINGGIFKTLGNNSSFALVYRNLSIKDATLDSYESDGIVIKGSSTVTFNNNSISNGNTFLRVIKNDEDINAKVILVKQKDVNGDIVVDNNSKLSIQVNDNSSYKGIINGDNKGLEVNLVVSSNSSITLMGDSYVSSLSNGDNSNSNIIFNGYKLYVNGKAIDKIVNNNDSVKEEDNNKDVTNDKKVTNNEVKSNTNQDIVNNNDKEIKKEEDISSIDTYDNDKVIHKNEDIKAINKEKDDNNLVIINIIGILFVVVSVMFIVKNSFDKKM